MVVLRKNRKCYKIEAKQVGVLYHITTLTGVADYIAPNDTLSSSGKYKNWLFNGSTNIVSFTRDKSFVVSTRTTRQAPVILDFAVDGDLLSENHKITPYNDLAFDRSGELEDIPLSPNLLEHEEAVKGSIYPFSRYVKSVRFSVSICDIDDIILIHDDLQSCKEYLSKFSITNDPKLQSKLTSNNSIVPFPSFDSFVSTIESISDLFNSSYNNSMDKEIQKAFTFFSKELLEQLVENELRNTESDPNILSILDLAIEQKGGNSVSLKKSKLTYSQIENKIDKDLFLDDYIEGRLDKYSKNSYMDYSLSDKLTLLLKYGKFDSEQFYTISNIAKTWFNKHSECTDCGIYGKLNIKDLEDKSNLAKILNYLYLNYDRRKIDSVLFDIILMDGKNIATQEFKTLQDPERYTLGISQLKGNDLFEYLTTWSDIFSESELENIIITL